MTLEQAESQVGMVQFLSTRGYWHACVSFGDGNAVHFAANEQGEIKRKGKGRVIMHTLRQIVGDYLALEFVPNKLVQLGPLQGQEQIMDRAIDFMMQGFPTEYRYDSKNGEAFAMRCVYRLHRPAGLSLA